MPAQGWIRWQDGPMNIEPKMIRKDGFVAVGMRITTAPLSAEIPQLWARFAPRLGEVPSIAEPYVNYGIMQSTGPAPGRLDYMAAVSVAGPVQAPEGMVAWPVEGGRYAVFETTLSGIGNTFAHIYGAWLAGSGFEPADAPCFERYDESFDPQDPGSRIEIYIPLKD